MALNLNRLRFFDAVADGGTVTEAALRLRVSQPAVSKQLQDLEAELGLQLFDRGPRGITLTQAGLALLPHVRRLLQEEVTLERSAAAMLGLDAGHLAVGASTTIGNYLVPELFQAVRSQRERVTLELQIGNTQQVQRLLLAGAVEVGLTEGLATEDELDSRVFTQDTLVLIAAPGHPVARGGSIKGSDLAELPVLVREAGSGSRAVIEAALRPLGVVLRPAIVLGSTEAIKNAAARGIGVGLVSRLTVELELATGRLLEVPLEGLSLKRDLHLVMARGRTLSPLAAEFVRVLTERYG